MRQQSPTVTVPHQTSRLPPAHVLLPPRQRRTVCRQASVSRQGCSGARRECVVTVVSTLSNAGTGPYTAVSGERGLPHVCQRGVPPNTPQRHTKVRGSSSPRAMGSGARYDMRGNGCVGATPRSGIFGRREGDAGSARLTSHLFVIVDRQYRYRLHCRQVGLLRATPRRGLATRLAGHSTYRLRHATGRGAALQSVVITPRHFRPPLPLVLRRFSDRGIVTPFLLPATTCHRRFERRHAPPVIAFAAAGATRHVLPPPPSRHRAPFEYILPRLH